MASIDFDVSLEDAGLIVLQELWNKLAIQTVDLVAQTRDVTLQKDSFQEFSTIIYQLNTLLQAIDLTKIETAMGSQLTKTSLHNLIFVLDKAQNIIKDYKTGSRLRLLLHSQSLLSQMECLTKEIAQAISSFQLLNLDIALSLKTMIHQIIHNLNSMEFRSATRIETMSSAIQASISQNSRNKESAIKLLEKIADAVGSSPSQSLVQNELTLLKQEKEEMENAKKQAEALQLSQLIQLLYTTEMVADNPNEEVLTDHQQYPISSFICPLCNEIMMDPVTIWCGHSFERKAIQEYFKTGQKRCPTCKEELSSTQITPNMNLRSSIEEWKQQDMELTFRSAASGFSSDDYSIKNKSLEAIQLLMEQQPHYATKAAQEGFILKLVESLKDERLNSLAALKCLNSLAEYSDDHKEAITEAGAVRRIMKLIYKGQAKLDALALLLELSKIERFGEKIGKTKDCIPLLVSLLHNDNPDVSLKAQQVLQNLSFNTHFVVKMAKAEYFQPFLARFKEGAQETRALMAAAFLPMPLTESSVRDLKDEIFIHNLVDMLSSNSPASKSVCLKCIKKLIVFRQMAKQVLLDSRIIPYLLGLISLVRYDSNLKQEAADILTSLVAVCQPSHILRYEGLQELQSSHSIGVFLRLVASPDPHTKMQFLHLLIELCNKSETVRNLICSDIDAVTQLFSSLDSDHPVVRRCIMKLIYCMSEGHPAGVPLPLSPGKETAIYNLADILSFSPNMEERSIAAGIISRLPREDVIIDDILGKSQALKAIHEVICRFDGECTQMRSPVEKGTFLLENALAALLRFTEPTKPELQREVSKLELYPSLVRILSTGSSLAKQRTATALAHLSQSTSFSVSRETSMTNQVKNSKPLLQVMDLLPSMQWCCSGSADYEVLCPVHGVGCSARYTFCLVKSDALKPLVKTLSETEPGVAEAALMALETLLIDHNTLSHATAAIVDSQGVLAILQVLEKGSLPAKIKALDLFQKILNHTHINDQLSQRAERVLIQLLHDDTVRKNAALVLRQMNVIPDQSSYF